MQDAATAARGSPIDAADHSTRKGLGTTTDVVPAVSGVTFYRVNDRVIDGGEFIPLK